VIGPERPPWAPGHGLLPAFPGATVTGLWDHHAVVRISGGGALPKVGDQVTVIPNHVCTVVNLVDYLQRRAGRQTGGPLPGGRPRP
jgi:D-serine deaminase-like pyridoxal phosphate-dependent protein